MDVISVPKKKDVHFGDRLFLNFLRLCGIAILCVLLGIAWLLASQAWPIFQAQGLGFFASTLWDPVLGDFGAATFIWGTVVSSLIALFLSVPVSVGVALFLSDVLPASLARWVGFLVEMLAAIPSVVYGLWGVFVLAPFLRTSIQPWLGEHLGWLPLFQGPPYGVGMMAAGIVLAIMITPTIAAVCREVFRAVPTAQREAALALGATRWETIRVSVLSPSLSGILSAVILGLGRAFGETMAVTMVIGNRPEISFSLLAPAQTMASVIANEYAEAEGNTHLAALAGVGLALFAISLITNSIARWVLWRMQAKMGRGR